jgi:hypothetical protein
VKQTKHSPTAAQLRWPKAWIGGAGPIACVVTYLKRTSVTLFKTKREANKLKKRLDAIAPEKKRWTQTEVIDLKARAVSARTR